MAQKPSAIIFGGVNTFSRALAAYLVPETDEALVSHLRIVDKFSVAPATTYIGTQFPRILQRPHVEYQQANLANAAMVTKMFDPPEGQAPYSYVFDCTGEVRYDRPEVFQIDQTALIVHSLGQEAARRKVKAYVRLQPPFYDSTSDKTPHTEKDQLKPQGSRGIWWHEALRMLASVKDLNLVILRVGSVYGPHTLCAEVTYCLILGAVYKSLNEELKFLFPGNRINTVHTEDVAGASWAVAEWMAKLGRAEADRVAGEDIYFANDKDKVKDVKGAPAPSEKLVAPLFNLVDDSDATQSDIGAVVAKIFGIKHGSHGFLASTFAKISLNDVAEEANEAHMETWMRLITNANPPIPYTPLTAYMDPHMFGKYSISYSASKVKKVAGYQLKRPKLTQETVNEVLLKFKEDGIWPAGEGI